MKNATVIVFVSKFLCVNVLEFPLFYTGNNCLKKPNQNRKTLIFIITFYLWCTSHFSIWPCTQKPNYLRLGKANNCTLKP